MQISKETQEQIERLSSLVNDIIANPWKVLLEPYQIIPDIYYVGNKFVGSYLLNTDEGLILIDTAFQETAFLLFESIRKLGFDPQNIKKILISHGHFDHCGAVRLIQEYSGCEVYFPEGDSFFLTERRDLIMGEIPEFRVDGFFDYNNVMDLGNIKIRPVHTPGHTPGCTSFFITAECEDENLVLGMHGGLGLNGLSLAELENYRLPASLQQDYLRSLEKVAKEHVDIVIPSHISHFPGDYLALVAQNNGTGNALRNPDAWNALINERIRQANALIEFLLPISLIEF